MELLGWVGGLGPLDWVAGCQEGLNRVGESWPGPLSSRPSLERYRGAAQGAGPAGGGCRGCRERIGHFPRILSGGFWQPDSCMREPVRVSSGEGAKLCAGDLVCRHRGEGSQGAENVGWVAPRSRKEASDNYICHSSVTCSRGGGETMFWIRRLYDSSQSPKPGELLGRAFLLALLECPCPFPRP